MALVLNNKSALYGGVNQQSAVHRQETQVEEMINATPTLNTGLLKRNPTTLLELNDEVEYDSDMWSYEYDKGLAGDSEEKYSIQIGSNGMQIINVVSGKVYTKTNGLLTFEDSAEDYISHFVNRSGYSAITIKDTTFIANKNIAPQLDPYTFGDTEAYTSEIDVYRADIAMAKTPLNEGSFSSYSYLSEMISYGEYSEVVGTIVTIYKSNFAPSKLVKVYVNQVLNQPFYDYYLVGCTTSLVVDGNQISFNVPNVKVNANEFQFANFSFTSYSEYLSILTSKLREQLDSSKYIVSLVDYGSLKSIRIVRTDGVEVTTSFNIAYNVQPTGSSIIWTSVKEDYNIDTFYSNQVESVTIPSTEYEKTAFFWIKGSNPTAAYSYTYVLTSSTHSISGTVSATTTEAVAIALNTSINSKVGFTSVVSGNIVKVVSSDESLITNISITDTYGNQASYAWHMKVQYLSDLPKSMPYTSLVKVVDVENSGNSLGYWIKYSNGFWEESLGLDVQPKLSYSTMPHILTRNSDDTFTMKQYNGWEDMKVGDNESNKAPSFVQDNNTIKDMFFFKNRLGFITNNTVILSEVGKYGNFFRTSVVALLDSDRIDASVDTTKSIQLEYAVYLQDSIMLFSDKAQFKLDGGRVLSPDSVQVSQTSSYEININIRPVFMNSIIFFCAIRGNYTAVMQYFVSSDNVSEAIDITAHVDKYIPSDIISMTVSPINNMIFLTSKSQRDLVYVYKYYDEGNTRVQAAWFKWLYEANLYRVFAMGKNLNFMTDRQIDSKYIAWVIGSGLWDNSEVWDNSGFWISEPNDLIRKNRFEVQPIHPIEYNGYFVDASEYIEDTDNIVKLIGNSDTSSSLVYNISYNIILNTKIKLLDSNISSYVINANITNYKNEERVETSTNSELVISRSPYDYITSIEIIIEDVGILEFSGISFTTVGSDVELLANSSFAFGTEDWAYTGWDIEYNNKDIGYNIKTNISLGEWVYGDSQKTKQISGNLKMKSCIIDAEDGSNFGLVVENVARATSREILSKYTVGKKPIIFGDSKNIRLHITDNSNSGFRITSLSLEGNYNARDRRK